MNKENTEKLFKKYPKIFIQKDLGPRESLMCFGFECGDGWYMLIDELCEALQFHTDTNSYPQVEAVQVKEKFGGLRFYVTGGDEYLRGYIDFAEIMSYKFCETCGSNKDVTQTKGWIKVRCKECLDNEGQNFPDKRMKTIHDIMFGGIGKVKGDEDESG